MAQSKRTTTQRGYGSEHQRDRARLLREHVDGTLCGGCGQPMWKDEQELDANHSVSLNTGGQRADRLMHASCNRSRGDGTRESKAAAERERWTTLSWA